MGALKSGLRALKKNKNVDLKKAQVNLSDSQKPIPCISTGSIVLNYLIGGYRTKSGEKRCPGIPRGRITEIFGPEGSGKCVTQDTLLMTEYGMMTLGELFEREGFDLTDEQKIVPHEVRLLNEKGDFEKTSHVTFNGRKTVRRLQTQHGYQLESTLNHPVRVKNADTGKIEWKKTGEVQEGDFVVMMRGSSEVAGGLQGGRLSPDTAKLLGYLAADRPLPAASPVGNSDTDIIDDFKRRVASGDKTIPLCVRTGGVEAQKAFLRAYLDSEFSIDVPNRSLVISSDSEELLRQMQGLLLALGIVSIRSAPRPKGSGHNEYASLTLGYAELLMFAQEVGFVSQPLKDFILKTSDPEAQSESESSLPQAGDVSDNGYFFSEIVEVTELKDVPTYDVCLPDTHSFWSNGFVSHNTTVAIHAAINAQRAGGSVVFMDYEHAFSPTYAADLGLNVEDEDTFILLQPAHWEEGAEIIQAMCQAGVDLIIVDSLAAMKPQRDVEGDVSNTGQVGHIARLQSSFLPKIVKDVEQSNTSLVYLNQLRSRIKTSMYDSGPDEETSGGRALKYYASLRIMLKRVRTEYAMVENELTGKDEKQPISNIIRAKNVKNKVSKHQGHQGEFVIRYGEGVDNVRSVIDIGEARKVITRSGAWYSFCGANGEEVKAQGKENLRDHLLENEDDFYAIAQQVQAFSRAVDKAVKVKDEDIQVEDIEEKEKEFAEKMGN